MRVPVAKLPAEAKTVMLLMALVERHVPVQTSEYITLPEFSIAVLVKDLLNVVLV